MADETTIDGFGPLPLCRTASESEACALVADAAARDQAVYPSGGRTFLHVGHSPTKPGFALDTRGLSQVIDYPFRDMTITVQAGITLARLGAILGERGQFLPIDVPNVDVSTLGGAMAVNVSGSRRYGYGTLRDYVIGMRAINDRGQSVKAGGRVVKNVAGYDLCKLYIGALGTLGVVTEVTLKTRPLPDETAVVLLSCRDAALVATLDLLSQSQTRPVAIDALNRSAARSFSAPPIMGRLDSHWLLLVGFDGNHEAVKWQIDQLARELAASDAAIMDTIIGPAARHFWATLCNEPMQGGQQLSLYATIRSSATARFCQDVALLDPECAIHAHAGNGIVRMNFGEQWTEGTARVLMNKLLQSCGEHGNVVVRRCPTTWKPQLPIWGKVRGDLAMMHAVHKALDPNGRFNPGRLLKGI